MVKRMSEHIVIFGTYPLLLQTHRLILERSGFSVTLATRLADFRTLIDRQDIDLCLFCSSLDAGDREEAIATLGMLLPGTPYIMLAPGVSVAGRRSDPPIVNCLAGPEFLLNSVRESLALGALPWKCA
jgi:DNA-binding NtrC family response regulator